MLTGNPPHTGASAQQIIMKIITESAAPVTTLRKNVPPNVAAALAQALEKVPADRFESAKAFAEALGNRGWTSAAMANSGAGLRAGTPRATARTLVAVSAVALLATAVAGWALLRPAPQPRVARFPLLLPERQQLTTGGGTMATLTPDGATLVYVGGDAATRRLWVRRLDQLDATPLAGTEWAQNPSVSPDGTRIAFIGTTPGSPRALKVVPLAGGPVLTLTDSLVDLGGVAWGYDGYIYFDGHLEGDGFARIKETGGHPEVASKPDTSRGEVYHNSPSALPNGRGVLFTARVNSSKGTTYELYVLDTRTGTHRALASGVAAAYAGSGHLLYVTEDGKLMAASFDQDALTLAGDAVPVGEGVSVRGGVRASLSLSSDGQSGLCRRVGGGARRARLVWVTRDGVARAVDSSWTGGMTGRPTLSPTGIQWP